MGSLPFLRVGDLDRATVGVAALKQVPHSTPAAELHFNAVLSRAASKTTRDGWVRWYTYTAGHVGNHNQEYWYCLLPASVDLPAG